MSQWLTRAGSSTSASSWTFRSLTPLSLVLSILLLSVPTAGASSGDDWTGSDTVRRTDNQDWKVKFWTGVEYQGETDLETTGGGDFEYWMVSGGADATKMVSESVKVALKTDYRAVGYDFSTVAGTDPWETIHVMRLNPLMSYLFNDNWSMLAGPIVEFSGEGRAKFKDSLRGGANFGFGYTNGGFYIAAGVIAMSEIEEDLRIQPFALVNWSITDGLSLGVKADTSRGGEFRLEYLFAETVSIGAGIGFRRERFRLNGDNGIGTSGDTAREDGIGEEEATVAKLTVGYHVNETMVIEGYGGVTADGNFKLENENGDKIVDADYDDSGFGGINLRFKF
jgi:hypothetical protein